MKSNNIKKRQRQPQMIGSEILKKQLILSRT